MITYSAAGYWIDTICGTTSRTGRPVDDFPDMGKPGQSGRRSHLRAARTVIAGVPQVLARLAAGLVPSPIKAVLAARAGDRELARNIQRLEDLAPHLLSDIGIEQVAAGVYVNIDQGEAASTAPAAVRAVPPRPVQAVPRAALWAVTGWSPAQPRGVALP